MKEKSKREIEMDFTKAVNQAQELEALADSLSRIANSGVESALLVLKNNWRGDSGGSIEVAGKKTIAEIFSTADDLLRVAHNIRHTADIVYNAEIAARAVNY